MPEFGRALRRKFRLESGVDFLNHGSFGAAPVEVLDAAARWREQMEANPDHFLRDVLPGALRNAARDLGRLIGADGDDLVFVENATTAINAVLRSLDFKPGDEILINSQSYGAVRQAVRYICERTGAKAVEPHVAIPVDGPEQLVHAISERTRLVIVDHISSPTGLVWPVEKVVGAARKRGALVLVDGAHAPGQLELDVPALGADWYTGNCHKWLFTPRGCAFLWSRADRKAMLHPLAISHGYGKGFTEEFDWPGTRDFSSWLAVSAGLRFFSTRPQPVSVPPVPTPMTRTSILPPVSFHSSSAVVFSWTSGLAGFSNWLGCTAPGSEARSSFALSMAPGIPPAAGVSTSSAPRWTRIFRRSIDIDSGITSISL